MKLFIISAAICVAASTAGAQTATNPPKRAQTCARAIKMYEDIKQVPVPHDTVQIPAPDGPVRVTNEAEMEVAQQALKARAATVGATGVLVSAQEVDDGSGMVRVSRRLTGIYVRADSAAAQKTCNEKGT